MVPFLKDITEGGVSGIFSGIKELISQFHTSPEEKSKALQQVMEFEGKLYQIAASVDVAQIELNKVEAASPNLFNSGWRPFVGWTCGGALAYETIARDILNWVLSVVNSISGAVVPLLPVVSSDILATTLAAMLGMAGARTYEKLRGVARA